MTCLIFIIEPAIFNGHLPIIPGDGVGELDSEGRGVPKAKHPEQRRV